jgi:pimeloyl-ACP methyl ester carboxylesterase
MGGGMRTVDVVRDGARVGVAVEQRGRADVPALVLHGGGPGCSSWTDFAAVLPAILDARGSILLMDLVQHGHSDFAPIHAPMWSFHADVVNEVLDHLGVEVVDVAAQSMGSAVAFAAAARRPGRIRRAVCTGVAPYTADQVDALGGDPGFGAAIWHDAFAHGAPTASRLRGVLARCEWADGSRIPDDLVRARCAVAAKPHQDAMAEERSLRGQPEDLLPALAGVDAEVTCLWGGSDPFVTEAMRADVSGRLPRLRGAHVIDDASHHAQSEQPRRWLELALASLDD